jgi:hypothetical protein
MPSLNSDAYVRRALPRLMSAVKSWCPFAELWTAELLHAALVIE